MKTSIKSTLLAVAALLFFCGSAQATPTFANINLDPALSQASANNEVICDGLGFPSCTLNASGPSQYTITFLNGGFFSSSISASVVDTSGVAHFSLLNYTILDPSSAVVLANITSESNLAVLAGIYTIVVNWTFVGSPNAASAGWAMPLTTGPNITQTPEPGTAALIGLGLLAAAAIRRRKS